MGVHMNVPFHNYLMEVINWETTNLDINWETTNLDINWETTNLYINLLLGSPLNKYMHNLQTDV